MEKLYNLQIIIKAISIIKHNEQSSIFLTMKIINIILNYFQELNNNNNNKYNDIIDNCTNYRNIDKIIEGKTEEENNKLYRKYFTTEGICDSLSQLYNDQYIIELSKLIILNNNKINNL
jgi:RNA processing factor Prp31